MLIELMKDLLVTVENYLFAVYSKDPFHVTVASLTIFQALSGFLLLTLVIALDWSLRLSIICGERSG